MTHSLASAMAEKSDVSELRPAVLTPDEELAESSKVEREDRESTKL